MAITKTVVGKVRLSEKSLKVRSFYKDDDEALRAMGASGLKPQGFTLMHVERHGGTGFGKVGATRKPLCYFGVKPWLIVCFHIVKGGKRLEIVYSNKREHLKELFRVFDRLCLVVKGTKVCEGDFISSPIFKDEARQVHKRIKAVMERNAAQKAYVKKWELLCDEGAPEVKKGVMREVYYNERRVDGSYNYGVKDENDK